VRFISTPEGGVKLFSKSAVLVFNTTEVVLVVAGVILVVDGFFGLASKK
jgi:hypothetical protein